MSVDRRQFLQAAVVGAVVRIAPQSATSPWLIHRASAHATLLTPETAVEELLAGNRRFAANQLTSIEHDLQILKEDTVEK